MDRLEQIKNEVAQSAGHKSWDNLLMSVENWTGYKGTSPDRFDDMWEEVARRYATEMVRHNLERAAGQAAIEAESPLSGKTIHGSINSEDPQWVARVNRESIINTEIELI